MRMTKPPTEALDAIWRPIDGAEVIVLAMHVNPDGDALGSGIAFARALRKIGKRAHLVCSQKTPDIYAFLQPQEVMEEFYEGPQPDLAILLDCDRPERTADQETLITSARETMVIDHHPPSGDYGDYRLTEVEAAATAELIHVLVRHRGIPIDLKMAQALLTGLITDTGCFRFPNTTPRTLHCAAELVEIGASTADISERVYDTRSQSALRLLARTLNSIQTSPKGTVVWAKLGHQDFLDTGAKPEETEGFVNIVHSLEGADVAAFLREEAPGTVRISLRGRQDSEVNHIAESLGGGGHKLAAAAVLQSSLPEAEARLVDLFRQWTEF